MALKKGKQIASNKRSLITMVDSKSPISEQYRTIRTNIQYSTVDKNVRTLMVTSSGPGEGKSTTVANLAVTFAQQGKKVLLVDADMRKPTVHYTFNQTNTFGLTSVLTKQLPLEEAISETSVENLFVLTSGPIPPNPSELLSSKSMEQIFQTSEKLFDIILFDTPPLLAVTDAQILSNRCEGTVLVVYSGKTEKEQMIKAKELLDSAQSKLLGVVVNHKRIQDTNYYYYYGTK
ncbi:CpsD/CapB family tyrosine-protein kinase [Neobacillus sp. MM2021_6]|uniref:CpsD/CapB family tyrosine-protein kinase n=1 Tax=Bacillaceae TaxID=186817 RepID=UPI00140E3968|nr:MULTISPECIES: CpsD/CapB family tyrosine-protein kinase [Bacillaceae]MBO0961031.1 CpsD/CapB family tyrosine-protein kinase [Neobacillus sp. MM2021_6]NHC19057.1 CpsD/CapB family tyrosine-protein kinase [Bacillus sp. MM2020_4]